MSTDAVNQVRRSSASRRNGLEFMEIDKKAEPKEPRLLSPSLKTAKVGLLREPNSPLPWFPRAEGWRSFIFRMFDDVDSSKVSAMFSIVSSSFVILSTVSLLISSLPKYRYPNYGTNENSTPPVFHSIELVSIMFFTVEYLVRMLTVSSMKWEYITGKPRFLEQGTEWYLGTQLKKTWSFFLQPMNLIDLAAILPFYLKSVMHVSINLTSLRSIRLLRLVKLFRKNRIIPLLAEVFSKSITRLYQVFVVLMLVVYFMAATIFILEQGEYNAESGYYERDNVFGEKEPSPFDSVFVSLWFTVVSLTTVGYGDMTPTTVAGRSVMSLFIMMNLILFAIPITVVSSAFMDEAPKQQRRFNKQAESEVVLHYYLSIFGRKSTKLLRERAEKALQREGRGLPLLPHGDVPHVIFSIFEDVSSKVGLVAQLIMTLTILVSVIALGIESLPQYRYPNYGSQEGDTAPAFKTIEIISSSIFSIEFCARLFTVGFVSSAHLQRLGYKVSESDYFCGKIWTWFRNFGTIIDLISIVPFYLEMALHGGVPSLMFFRILRLLRLTRIFKIIKGTSAMAILTTAISNSLNSIGSLGLLFIVWILVISSVIFYLERGSYNPDEGYYERETFLGAKERSPFLSIPDTCWWMMATITTVGYGDLYPTSLAGRVAGSFAMFISIVFVAIPISLVAVNIERATREFLQDIRHEAREEAIDRVTLISANASLEFNEDFKVNVHAAEGHVQEIDRLIDYHTLPEGKFSDAVEKVHEANLLLLPVTLGHALTQLDKVESMIKKTRNKLVSMAATQRNILHTLAVSNNEEKKISEFYAEVVQRSILLKLLFRAWRKRSCRSFKQKRPRGVNNMMGAPMEMPIHGFSNSPQNLHSNMIENVVADSTRSVQDASTTAFNHASPCSMGPLELKAMRLPEEKSMGNARSPASHGPESSTNRI